MFRFWIACKKELLILWNDKTGLALMFFMPVLLVFIITIIQDSAFQIVNENKVTLIVANKDTGEQGQRLVKLLDESRFFTITERDSLSKDNIKQAMNAESQIAGLIIPVDFSDKLTQKSRLVSDIMLEELEVKAESQASTELNMPSLLFYHDPVLQENFSSSIINVVNAFVKSIEGDLLIKEISAQLQLDKAPERLEKALTSNQVTIEQYAATLSENELAPNSTQHNVPAWTIFAIFFMVIPMGNNLVKERLNGSFMRLKTMPTNFTLVLWAKLFIYLLAVILQVSVIFSLARFTFPSLGLPELVLPDNLLACLVVVIMTGLSAISFSAAVGMSARTQEQANGFGAVAIVIFAAIGGVLVPSFVMPEYMQVISHGSPLYWCLECFYTLFLKGGNWQALWSDLLGLFIFCLVCFVITFFQLKKNRIV
ncbi:ABC transporter permease [Fulvivirga maritima]|uniref:ABC transporter permease n=1 Tax=Fulvivirga maritima TaxID=2904247 RepID=UPI001F322668|nr:ABC transporter permease [Fulvivirga maritima]UII27331.1 ABC transporter permease [Fulvivirga maritima]